MLGPDAKSTAEQLRAKRGLVAGAENLGQPVQGAAHSVYKGLSSIPVLGPMVFNDLNLTGQRIDVDQQKALTAVGANLSRSLDPAKATDEEIRTEALVRRAQVENPRPS